LAKNAPQALGRHRVLDRARISGTAAGGVERLVVDVGAVDLQLQAPSLVAGCSSMISNRQAVGLFAPLATGRDPDRATASLDVPAPPAARASTVAGEHVPGLGLAKELR
jgi:hypothetical protein